MTELDTCLEAGIEAVLRAAKTCRRVQAKLQDIQSLTKSDRSPVTVADFAAQAVVNETLHAHGLSIPMVGEESSKTLRDDDQAPLLDAIRTEVNAALSTSLESDQVLEAIDRGDTDAQQVSRYWTLDPVDGTKGFLRGQNYAIALALIEDGQVKLGVLGCPNLPYEQHTGTLMVATRGGGSHARGFSDEGKSGASTPIHVSQQPELASLRFCESVEAGHSDHDKAGLVAKSLGITSESVRIDSQCKYALVAQGSAEIYLRLPTRPGYQEKIWDHAAGMLAVEEAGGTVTDVSGNPLDFAQGKTLSNNRGILASHGTHHRRLVETVAQIA